MRHSFSTLLLAVGADLVLASHNHHRHHHGKFKPHLEVAPRDINRNPANIRTETRTLTTTVFEDCIPTNTRYVTTTIFEDYPEPTSTSKSMTIQEVPSSALPKPSPIENVLEFTTSKTEVSQDMLKSALSSSSAVESTPEPVTTTAQAITPDPAKVEEPVHSQQPTTSETSTYSPSPRPQNDHVEHSSSQTEPKEQTTTIHMTKTITDAETTTPTIFITEDLSSTTSSPSKLSPSQTSIEERPEQTKPSKTEAPQDNNILPNLSSLPSILPSNPTEIIPHLPVPGLDEVLHPEKPPVTQDLEWTDIPADGNFATKKFGGHSKPAGTRISYHGNVGVPWGSNIITVSPTEAHRYKYVAQFSGANTEPWTVIIWNKIGPDGKMDGWYSHSAVTFVLAPGETKYVAFDEDSVGAWGAAPGTNGLPTDNWGGYTSTWGEFSFGDVENNGWSGWDVSAIQAQIAKQKVQGMQICMADGKGCSTITPDAKKVIDAYTESKKHHDGIGGAAAPGPVRLVVKLDYKE
ncbi:hypothetical protein PENSTE_c020G02175 [Penicillium steckii]|uniref:Allergen Asp f 4 n=1 Tax=Penicillium steckii TaxID=303698 RepID=A0A1V6SV77_9EURO|nr:hypothetical protein PENSTE_c020G02175 [Penicillium steckii]